MGTLYLRTDTVYSNIKFPNDYFVIDKPLIVIEILHGYDSGIMQSYIKVDNKEQVHRLIEILSADLEKKQRSVFEQFGENIKRLEN